MRAPSRLAFALMVASASMPLAAKDATMQSSNDDFDVARHADAIIAGNKALRVASETCKGNAVVKEYAQALKQPLAWIIRTPTLFDAAALPAAKQDIAAALFDCARDPSLGEDDRVALGDLAFYLSYFIDGMNEREDQPDVDFFAEQRAEGQALRSEWRTEFAARSKTSFFSSLTSWLKTNA